jgi:hypothetical protein
MCIGSDNGCDRRSSGSSTSSSNGEVLLASDTFGTTALQNELENELSKIDIAPPEDAVVDSDTLPTPPTTPVAVEPSDSEQLAPPATTSSLPHVTPRLIDVCTRRHARGWMHPWVVQVLTTGELRVPVAVEEHASTLPLGSVLWRPVRQVCDTVLAGN